MSLAIFVIFSSFITNVFWGIFKLEFLSKPLFCLNRSFKGRLHCFSMQVVIINKCFS